MRASKFLNTIQHLRISPVYNKIKMQNKLKLIRYYIYIYIYIYISLFL